MDDWTDWLIPGIAAIAAVFLLTRKASALSYPIRTGKGPKWDNLPARNKRLITTMLTRAQLAGLNVGFFDGWRSPKTQLTKMSAGKLSNPYNSYHVWGEAWDIVFLDRNGNWTWPPKSDPRWESLGRIGEALGLKWGGRWTSFFDGAHFQTNISMSAIRSAWNQNTIAYLRRAGVNVIV